MIEGVFLKRRCCGSSEVSALLYVASPRPGEGPGLRAFHFHQVWEERGWWFLAYTNHVTVAASIPSAVKFSNLFEELYVPKAGRFCIESEHIRIFTVANKL